MRFAENPLLTTPRGGAMTAEFLFRITTTAVLPAWLLLILLPR